MGLSLDNDDEMMSDACHMRAALLTAGDLPGLPADLLPSDDRAGMLNHSESMANEAKDVARGLGREFSVRLSHPVVSAPFADTNARRPSVAFRQGEVEILSKILDEVDTTASKRWSDFSAGNWARLGRWQRHSPLFFVVCSVCHVDGFGRARLASSQSSAQET